MCTALQHYVCARGRMWGLACAGGLLMQENGLTAKCTWPTVQVSLLMHSHVRKTCQPDSLCILVPLLMLLQCL